jgi:hypothetical protein
MKKETLVAIVLGIAAGIGVAVIMLGKARESQMLSSKSISTSIQTSPTVKVNNQKFQPLEISEPDNNIIVAEKTIDIKGKAAPGSLMVVQSVMKTIVEKNDTEDFTIKAFPVSLGENTIRVTMYPKDTQIPPQEKELKIYFLDEQ